MALPTIKLIRDAAVPSEAVTSDTPAASVLELFSQQPDRLLVAVVQRDGRPVGLIDRSNFMLRLSAQYGHALYAKRPVSMLMNRSPLIVEGSREIGEFASDALATSGSDLLQGFIVVENGIYFGVSASLDLFRWMHRRSNEIAARAERERIFVERVIDNIPVMVFVTSAQDGRFLLVNRAAEDNLGYGREELLGRTASDVLPPDQAKSFRRHDAEVLASGRMTLMQDDAVRRKSGELRSLSTRKLAVPDEQGRPRWLVRVSEDITERKLAQAQIERLAHCDALTGLSNRVLFHRMHAASIEHARQSGTVSAILCIDLDRFKAVNDSMGHAAGDELLCLVADRLRQCTRKDDAIARLGGDEFAIVQSGLDNVDEVCRLAARIVEAVTEPYRIDGQLVEIGASVGFALFPQDGGDADMLLRRADMALYRAKANGRGRFQAFMPEMDAELLARRQLEQELAEALERRQFVLDYQPLISLASHQVVAFEALVRWQHPERGLLAPAEFLDLAEETAQILPLGRQILGLACHAAARLPAPVRMCVNLSPLQLRDPSLARTVETAALQAGLPPASLDFEIPEGALLREGDPSALLRQIKALGCRVTLDNFGAGTSSLNHLHSLPFDAIKIDRAFVQGLPGDRSALAILRALTGLTRALHRASVAEGVESQAQLHALQEAGCDHAQGFFLGKPGPVPILRQLGHEQEARDLVA